MPLTAKGEEILAAMRKQYGGKKGESVFYASRNKGTIKGVDSIRDCISNMHKKVFAKVEDESFHHHLKHIVKDHLKHMVKEREKFFAKKRSHFKDADTIKDDDWTLDTFAE